MHVIKKAGHREPWSDRKAWDAVYRACLNAHRHESECRTIASRVLVGLKARLKGKKEVSSDTLFRMSIQLLAKHDKDAAFLYETHRDLS